MMSETLSTARLALPGAVRVTTSRLRSKCSAVSAHTVHTRRAALGGALGLVVLGGRALHASATPLAPLGTARPVGEVFHLPFNIPAFLFYFSSALFFYVFCFGFFEACLFRNLALLTNVSTRNKRLALCILCQRLHIFPHSGPIALLAVRTQQLLHSVPGPPSAEAPRSVRRGSESHPGRRLGSGSVFRNGAPVHRGFPGRLPARSSALGKHQKLPCYRRSYFASIAAGAARARGSRDQGCSRAPPALARVLRGMNKSTAVSTTRVPPQPPGVLCEVSISVTAERCSSSA